MALPLRLLSRLTAGYDEARYLRPVTTDDVARTASTTRRA